MSQIDSPTPLSLIVRGGRVLLWDGRTPRVLDDYDIAIRDGHIQDVAPRIQGVAANELDARGCLVLPGLIDAHLHAGASPVLWGIPDDANTEGLGKSILYGIIGPLVRLTYSELADDELAVLVQLELAQVFRHGVTTVVDESVAGMDHVVRAVQAIGARAYVSATFPDVSQRAYRPDGTLTHPPAEVLARGLARGEEAYARHNGAAGGRIRVRLSPSKPEEFTPEALVATRRAADRLGCGISIHLAQTLYELEQIRARYGVSPVRWLADLGVLGPDVLATHVCFVDDEDIELLARSGTTVVYCPMRLAREGRYTPYVRMRAAGVSLAAATDSFYHDFVEVLRLGALIGKVSVHRNDIPTAADLLASATIDAARGLGRDDIGRIAVGARADLVCVDVSRPHNALCEDPVKALVYYSRASDLRWSLVDGQPVFLDGRLVGLDEPEIALAAARAVRRIRALARERGLL